MSSEKEGLNFKMLNYGEAGTGKTWSIQTLFPTGQKVRFIAAENNAITGFKVSMLDYQKKVKMGKAPALLPGQFGMMIPNRPKMSLKDLVAKQEKFVQIPLEGQFKSADPKRKDYTRYLEILRSTTAFIDDETGENMGSMDEWGPDTTAVIDSLTIICEAIKAATVGGKLAVSQPEWGVMQGTLVDFMRMLTEDLKCNLVILGHPVKEIDQVLGGQKLYPANLGQALNNLLPSFFTEVVYSYRDGKEFRWSTDHKQAVTRQTMLPLKDALPQDFQQLFK